MKKKVKQYLIVLIDLLPVKWKLRIKKVKMNKSLLYKKRREFYFSFFDDNKLFFDVGANLGNRIEPIIFDKIQIVAIEPQKDCIKHLENKFGDLITIEPVALGAKAGSTSSMHIANSSTVSSLSSKFIEKTKESGRFSEVSWDTDILVTLNTLDNLIDKHGVPGFIKIDVEGYENEVLKGLTRPVPALSIEYTLPELKEELIYCFNEIDRIYNSNFYFNYAPGEELVYGYENYRHSSELNIMFEDPKFNKSGFGDIYIKESF